MPSAEHETILIVDDDETLLQVLPETLRLRMPEIRVKTVTTPHAALEEVTRTDFNVIICDVMMPGASGIDLLGQIKTMRPWTPIIIISGHGQHGLARRAIDAGAYDFIAKPLDRDEFALAVKRALETHDLRLGGPQCMAKGFMLSVFGLDPNVSIQDLRTLFSPYGKILWARLMVNSNAHTVAVAYVEMATQDEAMAAVSALDGKLFNNRPIRLGPSLAPFGKWAI